MIYDHVNKTISTDRLLLRLFQVSDAETVARLCDNYNLYKSTLYLPYPYVVNDALSWMENHLNNFSSDRSYELAVTDRETGKLYGAIALSNNQNFRHGELAYWIGEEYWGKGYATEAAEAVIRFAFEEKKYHKVFARYFQSNPASGRVMEKLGMKEEGILADHVRKEGRYESLVCYGLINPADK
ncbi:MULTISPECIES: GNAT family N-acetyltransferase [Bacillus]|uniref:GNAT family N-acetyltransferase n=1 Tax=Bacillus infantis TaxID=324767 RepID=A0A5D4SQS3_9BACI|nr:MULTISPECIES: GNAT family N-acetyltransferase [Bacillus]MCA1033231.1 GNAT family N-acetyltransferase [Bacillus infantis]MCK6206612.1 GNAT family N-acetyltransferase [Bacillus infantis]TYS64176.1 GNAT family N-acetyltransferase [Bacillus infantis]